METNYKNLKNHELTELERKGLFRRWYYKPTQTAVSKNEYYFIADDFEDLKDILDDVKEKANQKLQEKQQEIEEAYRHYLEKTENPVPNNPQEKEQDQLDYDVTKGFRVS